MTGYIRLLSVGLLLAALQSESPGQFGNGTAREALGEDSEQCETFDAPPFTPPPATDWALLTFGVPSPEEERHIERLVVEFEPSYVSPERVRAQCSDGQLLRCLEGSLTLPLRLVLAENQGGGWGNVPIGTATVTTNKDQFVIGINPCGFGCGSKEVHFGNVFFSYGLARLIDLLFFKQTGKHLPPDLLQSLAGQKVIENDRAMWSRCSAPQP